MIRHFVPELDDGDIDAVVDALRLHRIAAGPEVAKLEEMLTALLGGRHAFAAVSSGTAALYLALLSLGVRPSDEVVIPSYTCNSLFAAVALTGAKAVCADTEPDSLVVSCDSVSRVVGKRTRVVVVPHTWGYLADIRAISSLGLPVIEDCTHVFGVSRDNGAMASPDADMGVVSFYATKLVAGVEGGGCFSRSHELVRRVRDLRTCDGKLPDPKAFNFKMSDLSAVLVQRHAATVRSRARIREALAREYDDHLSAWAFHVRCRAAPAVMFRYLLRVPGQADRVIDEAAKRGIMCRRPVDRPLHESVGGTCPRSAQLHESVVSIPFHTDLSKSEVDAILRTLPPILTGA